MYRPFPVFFRAIPYNKQFHLSSDIFDINNICEILPHINDQT